MFVGQAGIAVAGFLAIKLLTGLLDTREFGRLALWNTIVMLISTNVFGTVGQGLMRFWAISKARGELHSLYLFANRFAIIAGASLLFSAIVFSCIVSITHGFIWAIPVMFSSSVGIIWGCLNLKLNIFTAARQRKRVALLKICHTLLRPLVASAIIVMTVKNVNIVLLGYLIAALVIFFITQNYYKKDLPTVFSETLPLRTQRLQQKVLAKELFAYVWPFFIWAAFGWIHLSCDKWSLQSSHGPEVVGAFAVISFLATYPLIFGSTFLSTLMCPIVFQKADDLSSRHNVASTNRILLLGTVIYIIGAGFVIGAFSLFNRQFVILISNTQFARYSHLLPWLTLAWSIFYLGQMLVLWGFVTAQTRCYILPKCVASVIALSITFWLSIRMGPQGVIVGIGIAGVVYAVWCAILAIKFAREKEDTMKRENTTIVE